MKKAVIGIDPDVEGTGLALLKMDDGKNTIEICALPPLEAMPWLECTSLELQAQGYTVRIILEAGWLIKTTNFHGVKGKAGGKVSYQVGRNHAVGMLIAQYLRTHDCDLILEEVEPLKKDWQGPEGKITSDEIIEVFRNAGMEFPKISNQDKRDAALLAFEYSNLPIRICVKNLKPKTKKPKTRTNTKYRQKPSWLKS